MYRRAFTNILLAAGLCAATSASIASATETLRIGWLRAPNDITLAKAHGALEKALQPLGVDVTWVGPFAAAAPALEALNAGTIDMTAGSSTSAIAGLSARMPFVIFAYQKMAAGAEGILVKRGSAIQSIADLAGKSVAVNRGGTGEYLLMQALATSHIDPSTVKRVYLSPPDSAAAFSTGHVDAWATWDPFVSMALKSYDARLLADGAAIVSDNAVVLIASQDFAAKKRTVLQVAFETLRRENAWAVENPGAAGAIWADAMGLAPELGPVIGTNNAVPTRAVTDRDISQIGSIADWYVASGIVPRRPDIKAGVVQLKE